MVLNNYKAAFQGGRIEPPGLIHVDLLRVVRRGLMTLKGTQAFTSLFYRHILTEQKAEWRNWMFNVSAGVAYAPSPELHTEQVRMSNKCRCGWNRGKSSPRGSAHLPHCLKPGKFLVLSLDAVKRLHPRIHLPLSQWRLWSVNMALMW